MPTALLPAVPAYLTMREAARILGLSVRHVRRLVTTGDLKAYRPSRKVVYIAPGDIDEWIRRRPAAQVETTADIADL